MTNFAVIENLGVRSKNDLPVFIRKGLSDAVHCLERDMAETDCVPGVKSVAIGPPMPDCCRHASKRPERDSARQASRNSRNSAHYRTLQWLAANALLAGRLAMQQIRGVEARGLEDV